MAEKLRLLERITDAREKRDKYDDFITVSMAKAHEAGFPWQDIGAAAGMTRQAATERVMKHWAGIRTNGKRR